VLGREVQAVRSTVNITIFMTTETVETNEQTIEQPMASVLTMTPTPPNEGDLVSGTVIAIEAASVYVNLKPFGTGIIYGREYINARDLIKNLSKGDEVSATVIDTNSDEGYIELSIKEARQALIWGEANQALSAKTLFDIEIQDANKGGLIMEWQGIQGFLPASQLKPEQAIGSIARGS